MVARAQRTFASTVVIGLGVFVALSFVQLTLILVTLSPLFIAGEQLPFRPYSLLVSIGLALGIAAGGAGVAWTAWRRFRRGDAA